jgi:flagellum-specific ATP synthase
MTQIMRHHKRLLNHLTERGEQLRQQKPFCLSGKLTQMVGLTLEATGCRASIGSRCLIESANKQFISAEVVGFQKDRTYLMPLGQTEGLTQSARVIPFQSVSQVGVGDNFLGRIIDAQGLPLDELGPLKPMQHYPLTSQPINPLERTNITEPLDVGIRAINSLLTVGKGQRLGLFAGSGVGKSVLLGMMTRYTTADVIVVGLIGERGREVKEFIENSLGPEGLSRSIVVAAPSDQPPLMRLHGALRATAIAEYFRDRGCKVLLLMDSLTRFAQAQREIALAIGEPPATKGYPPSVFAKMPQLLERAGNGKSGSGSITAFYTVLTEGDDTNDPIADSARAILDGHIVLSRRLAEAGHYPAIDIEASISRVMPNIVSNEQQLQAQQFKKLWSKYQDNRDLINIGAYMPGSDPDVDKAIRKMPEMLKFLQQSSYERFDFATSQSTLDAISKAD